MSISDPDTESLLLQFLVCNSHETRPDAQYLHGGFLDGGMENEVESWDSVGEAFSPISP